MDNVIEFLNEKLNLSLKLFSYDNEVVTIETSSVDDIKNYNFYTLLCYLILLNNLEYITCNSLSGKKKLSFKVKKTVDIDFRELVKKVLECSYLILSDIEEDKNSSFTNMLILFYVLKVDGTIEYDVLGSKVYINIDGIPSRVIGCDAAGLFLADLSNNYLISRKFSNFGYLENLIGKINSPKDAHDAAVEYSEGREKLKNLLEYCYSNGIYTSSCCRGHEGRRSSLGNISFTLGENKTKNFFDFLTMKMLKRSICTYEVDENLKLVDYNNTYISKTSGVTVAHGIVYFDCGIDGDIVLDDILMYAREYVSSLNDEEKKNIPKR